MSGEIVIMDNKKFSYKESISELEKLLQEIENGSPDLDELTEKVKRATELLKLCKDNLRQTSKMIDEIIDEN